MAWRGRLGSVALLAVLAVTAVAASSDGAAGARRCGSVFVTVSDYRFGGPVEAKHVSCEKALRVIRYALEHLGATAPNGPRGWGCARGYPADSYYAFTCEERDGDGRAYLVRTAPRLGGKVDCGSTHATVDGLRVGGPVKARGVRCRRARAVVHFALTHARGNAPEGPDRWICARGGSPQVSRYALTCHRGDGEGEVWLVNGAIETSNAGQQSLLSLRR